MKPESRKRIEEFIKRVDYIESLSYLDGGEKIVGAEGKLVNGKLEYDFFQPDDEVRDALLLNIRLFIQNKDEVSLQRLTDLFSDPGISDNWKNAVKAYRKELNMRLNRIAAEGPKGRINHRDVLNMFLYGAISHIDSRDKSRKLYEKWVTDDTEYMLLHNTFHSVLVWIIAIIINISRACSEELKRQNI